MLLGKSYVQAGQNDRAYEQMRKGLRILDQVVHPNNPKYLAAQIAYSQAPDSSGAHEEAARFEDAAQQALKSLTLNALRRLYREHVCPALIRRQSLSFFWLP